MTHITSTKLTTRDGRQWRKVTCSCGHFIVSTDSKTTADAMAQNHVEQPECSTCHHRNVHTYPTGCTFESEPNLPDGAPDPDQLGCVCGWVAASPDRLATGGTIAGPVPMLGDRERDCTPPMSKLAQDAARRRYGVMKALEGKD